MRFQPLLAATCEDIAALRYPVLASPKLDGIRCVKVDGKALTRKLKPVPNAFVREWVERWLPDGIDGELMLRYEAGQPCGMPSFNDVSSAIMSRDGEPDFVFCAFDLLGKVSGPEVQFQHRLDLLFAWDQADAYSGGLGPGSAQDRLTVVPHERVETEAELRAVVARHLDAGYEGTMVRDPRGRYKFGRSTVKEGILLKIKPWHDEEATVTGVVEQMHNENEQVRDERGYAKRSSAKAGKVGTGKLGALVCLTDDGVQFEVGTGFTDEQRRDLWSEWAIMEAASVFPRQKIIGRQVKFKHLGRLPSGAPRGPVFLGWRED